MKITLTPMGGYAGAIRRPSRTLDTAQLSASAAEQLHHLADAAKHSSPPAQAPGRVRDGMSYQIELEGNGETATITQSDGAMSPEFEALLAFLEENA